jgi:hypothetical protein
LSPTPSISSAIQTPENTEKDPDDPEPILITLNQQMKEISKWNSPD